MTPSNTTPPASRLVRCACAVPLVLAAALAAARAADSITIQVNSSTGTDAIPANYCGLFEASNMGKLAYEAPYLSDYENLVNQMQVKYWRVEGASSAQEGNFFSFLSATNCPKPGLLWGLWLYADPQPLVDNPASALDLLTDAAKAPYIDAFAFGNEIDYQDNAARDPYVNSSSSATNRYYDNKSTPSWWKYPDGSAAPTGAMGYWQLQQAYVNSTLTANGVALPSYLGCDNGGTAPDGSNFVVNGTDGRNLTWMVRFANDEVNNIKAATQHLYVGDGESVPTWTTDSGGATTATIGYLAGDLVYDPAYTAPHTGLTGLFKCILKYVCASGTTLSPASDSTHWVNLEPAFKLGGAYNPGDIVADESTSTDSSGNPNHPGTLFLCVQALASANNYPSSSIAAGFKYWIYIDRSNYAFQSAHQLARYDLDPQRVAEWRTEVYNCLGNAPAWPSKGGAPLPYRMTEFSPYSGPRNGGWWDTGVDVNYNNYLGTSTIRTDNLNNTFVRPLSGEHTDCFASALTGLEMFHYFARHGNLGVNPEEGIFQQNSPIYTVDTGSTNPPSGTGLTASPPPNHFQAYPYAYAFPAFNLSGQPGAGKELWDSAVSVTSNANNDNVSAYGVMNGSDMYVILFNKSFDYDDDGVHAGGKRDYAITLSITGSFVPHKFQTMELSANGIYGDSTSEGVATLGGQTLNPAHSTFPASWTPSNTTYTTWGTNQSFTVHSFTALIVHIQ